MYRVNLSEPPYENAWTNVRGHYGADSWNWFDRILYDIRAVDVNNPQEIDFETEEDAVAFLLRWS